MTLQEFFTAHPKAALAFSGGADSAYLLYAARRWGCDVHAYYVKTAFQPAFELADARRLAAELNAQLTVLELPVLDVPEVRSNGPERCYYCKKQIFSAIARQAAADGYSLLMDGTNASDSAEDRPGMRALRELEVCSPLRVCGITKPALREASREAELFTWNKPAYACLATRIPTGQEITAEALTRTEQAESALSAMGFSDFRVRLRGGEARLQLREAQLSLALEKRTEILAALMPLYEGVTLDLEVRT